MVYGVHGTAREVGMASTDADHVGEIRNEGRILSWKPATWNNTPKIPTSRASLTNLSLQAAIMSYPHTQAIPLPEPRICVSPHTQRQIFEGLYLKIPCISGLTLVDHKFFNRK